MKLIKYSIIGLIIFFLNASGRSVETDIGIPEEIITAIKTGNIDMLSKYIITNLELTIDNKEDIYSKNQAILILEDFFKKNVPSSFNILHKGGSESSKYAIGNLITSNGNYRITIHIKLKDNLPYIHQLRIEKEDE